MHRRGGGAFDETGGGGLNGGLKWGLHSLFYDHAEDIGTSTLAAYTDRWGHSRGVGGMVDLRGGLDSLFYDHAE